MNIRNRPSASAAPQGERISASRALHEGATRTSDGACFGGLLERQRPANRRPRRLIERCCRAARSRDRRHPGAPRPEGPRTARSPRHHAVANRSGEARRSAKQRCLQARKSQQAAQVECVGVDATVTRRSRTRDPDLEERCAQSSGENLWSVSPLRWAETDRRSQKCDRGWNASRYPKGTGASLTQQAPAAGALNRSNGCPSNGTGALGAPCHLARKGIEVGNRPTRRCTER